MTQYPGLWVSLTTTMVVQSCHTSGKSFVASTAGSEIRLTSWSENKPIKKLYSVASSNTHGFHFACHGHLNAKEPFLSSFQLHDARLSNAELAFSCPRVIVQQRMLAMPPDEAIHFAAALQFCGFRSVVGTLWAMTDVDGPDVAEDFYAYMFREGSVSAMALNHATREMRKRRIPMDRWINFIHIGA